VQVTTRYSAWPERDRTELLIRPETASAAYSRTEWGVAQGSARPVTTATRSGFTFSEEERGARAARDAAVRDRISRNADRVIGSYLSAERGQEERENARLRSLNAQRIDYLQRITKKK
jgi:hypothetical protein